MNARTCLPVDAVNVFPTCSLSTRKVMYMYTHVCAHAFVHTSTHSENHIKCTRMYTHAHSQVHMYTCIQSNMHPPATQNRTSHIQKWTYVCMHTCNVRMHTHRHILYNDTKAHTACLSGTTGARDATRTKGTSAAPCTHILLQRNRESMREQTQRL